jgi:hypothetical protein
MFVFLKFATAHLPAIAPLPEPSLSVFVFAPQTPVTVLEAFTVQLVPMLELLDRADGRLVARIVARQDGTLLPLVPMMQLAAAVMNPVVLVAVW